MLRMKDLDNRTYNERLSDARSQLPLYTEDWTNFNPADPGVTILENLTAFENVQLGSISKITDAVRFGLLSMCGFTTKKGKASKLLLSPKNFKDEIMLPANKQLKIGDIIFETERATKVYPYSIINVFSFEGGKYNEMTHLTVPDVSIPAFVFGDNPAPGNAIYFMTNGLPQSGEDLIMYVNVMDRHNRNPFPEKSPNIFATIEWEIYTEQGFVPVNVKDTSAAFLLDGEIRIKIPKEEAVVFSKAPTEGYCIRAVLKECSYDIAPRLTNVHGFLIEVFQKETLSSASTFQKPTNVRFFSDMLKEGYIRVFAKEKKGSSYYMYSETFSNDYKGRYFRMQDYGSGMYDIEFDKDTFGYEPEKVKNCVKVLIYSEEMMRKYSIGKVHGIDNEYIPLPVKNVLPSSFCIICRRVDENGEYIYDFARPEKKETGSLYYHLYETEGKIIIEDPGDYIGSDLYIATATVFRGKEGNIRAGSRFVTEEGVFVNPGNGAAGCYRETLNELHRRFLEDLNRPYTAVTESDYEKLVKEIPQLCIRKVKAYADTAQNLVRVAVMPGTDEKFPQLSNLYKQEIANYLDDRRLLTTRIEIVQPLYVPVNVFGTIYIKKHFNECREEIENAIKQQIDYIKNDNNFGDTLSFNKVFHAVESLNCVEYIYDLTLKPVGSGNVARIKDSDVVINDNVLLYPGEISLDIGAYQ